MQAARRAHPLTAPSALHILGLTAGIGLILDQATKTVALSTLADGESVPAIDGLVHWTLQRNPGAAFSLFQKMPVAFTVIAFAISIGILVYARRVHDRLLAFGLGLVLAGALGNLGDRVFREPAAFRGHVVDFIDLRVWPTFNIADMCVVAGAALLFLASVRSDRSKRAAGSQ